MHTQSSIYMLFTHKHKHTNAFYDLLSVYSVVLFHLFCFFRPILLFFLSSFSSLKGKLPVPALCVSLNQFVIFALFLSLFVPQVNSWWYLINQVIRLLPQWLMKQTEDPYKWTGTNSELLCVEGSGPSALWVYPFVMNYEYLSKILIILKILDLDVTNITKSNLLGLCSVYQHAA